MTDTVRIRFRIETEMDVPLSSYEAPDPDHIISVEKCADPDLLLEEGGATVTAEIVSTTSQELQDAIDRKADRVNIWSDSRHAWWNNNLPHRFPEDRGKAKRIRRGVASSIVSSFGSPDGLRIVELDADP